MNKKNILKLNIFIIFLSINALCMEKKEELKSENHDYIVHNSFEYLKKASYCDLEKALFESLKNNAFNAFNESISFGKNPNEAESLSTIDPKDIIFRIKKINVGIDVLSNCKQIYNEKFTPLHNLLINNNQSKEEYFNFIDSKNSELKEEHLIYCNLLTEEDKEILSFTMTNIHNFSEFKAEPNSNFIEKQTKIITDFMSMPQVKNLKNKQKKNTFCDFR